MCLASPTLQCKISTWPYAPGTFARILPPPISHLLRSRAPQVGLDRQRLQSYLAGVRDRSKSRSKLPMRWKLPEVLFAVAELIHAGRLEPSPQPQPIAHGEPHRLREAWANVAPSVAQRSARGGEVLSAGAA